jgi:hypothetical protein
MEEQRKPQEGRGPDLKLEVEVVVVRPECLLDLVRA